MSWARWVPLLMLSAGCVVPGQTPDDNDDSDVDTPDDPTDDSDDDTLPVRPWEMTEDIPDGMMPEDGLFRIDKVVDVRLELSSQARSRLNSDPRSYVPARLRMYGQTFDVGMRLKGSSTFQSLDQKPSIKIAFDYSVQGQELFGYEGFNLHNCTADAAYTGDVVAHRMLRLAGVPSLKSGYVQVYIDGQLKGLYAIVQRKDHDWLNEWFSDGSGSLYEGQGCDFTGWGANPGCWNLDQAGDNDTRQDLNDFLTAMNTNGQAFWNTFGTRMDYDLVVRSFAAEWVLGHWDSYTGNLNNYHLYHNPTTDQWSLSPWSLDLAWSRPVGGACHTIGVNKAHYRSGSLGSRCQDDRDCDNLLEQHADDIMTLIEGYDVRGLFDQIEQTIEPYVRADPNGPGVQRWRQEFQCARDFIRNRRPELRLGP
ncbi:MAG TPA: CotH kinase family protein [Myxococcota bacterium]|nr:CotH kinase family protein [Myxococcota bacterium]